MKKWKENRKEGKGKNGKGKREKLEKYEGRSRR